MASKSIKVVLEGIPIESVIAKSKLTAEIKNIKAATTGKSLELPKVIIPEIDASWSLTLTPTSVEAVISGSWSYRDFRVSFEIETRPEAVWKSEQYKFQVSALDTKSKQSFVSGIRVNIDRNVKKQELTAKLSYLNLLADGSLNLDITVAILYIKNMSLRSNFYDPAEFSKRIVDNCLEMFENSTFSDFTFIVKDRKFKVHKAILAAASPVFDKTFTSAMLESQKNECIINKIDPDVFEDLLRFIYGGKLPENLADVSIKLYEAAHYYQIEQLMKICEQEIALKLDVTSAQDVYQWAHVYDIEHLKVAAWPVIKNEILKIYYPLKGEPLSPQMVQTLIARQQNEAEYWEQLRN